MEIAPVQVMKPHSLLYCAMWRAPGANVYLMQEKISSQSADWNRLDEQAEACSPDSRLRHVWQVKDMG